MKMTKYKTVVKSAMAYYLLAMIASGFLLTSCNDDPKHPGYEYMPNMYRSPSYETYSENPNFADSMTARKPVAGSVPRGFTPYPFPDTNEGYEASAKEWRNPLDKSVAHIEEGKRLFGLYCVYCHGEQGKGDGILVSNGKFPPPPSYSNQLKDLPEGKMYHSITYGKNLMGSHASQLNPEERWKVIMYVQTLQKLAEPQVAAVTDSTKKTN
jgi:mono/diheme cytochrome c family protein